MHHYGESAVRAEIEGDRFTITITNHDTGAEIVVTGPTRGVYEDDRKTMTEAESVRFGHELAHLCRRILTRTPHGGMDM